MRLVFEIVLLFIGFILLIRGADFFVEGSCAVAKKFKIPPLIIGLTIVSVGTSLPEFAVSALAAFRHSSEISYSNAIGSNLFNMLMVLGVAALLVPVSVQKSMIKREFPFLVGITLVLIFCAGEYLWFSEAPFGTNIFRFDIANAGIGIVNRIDGLLLILLFIGFSMWLVMSAFRERKNDSPDGWERFMSTSRCVMYLLGGIVGIIAGGELVVYSAEKLAIAAGMSETLVGLTVVALGTSLPELVTSAVAAKKGEADIAIGNVVGSNIANILLVLGVAALISPVSVTTMSLADAVISLAATCIVFFIVICKKSLQRSDGVLLIFAYLGYMIYVIMRQYA